MRGMAQYGWAVEREWCCAGVDAGAVFETCVFRRFAVEKAAVNVEQAGHYGRKISYS